VGRLYGISFLQHLTKLIPSISSEPILPWCGGLLLLLLATLIKQANRWPCHVSFYICRFIHISLRLIYLFLSPPCQIRMSLKFVMLATQTRESRALYLREIHTASESRAPYLRLIFCNQAEPLLQFWCTHWWRFEYSYSHWLITMAVSFSTIFTFCLCSSLMFQLILNIISVQMLCLINLWY
jgi:ABC-type multidrug transport system permease subunit